MRLITLQHKNVYETLIKDKIYKCTYLSEWHKESPKSYGILSKRLGITDGTYPIFAWANVIGLPIKMNTETLTRIYEMVKLDLPNYYAFELEVPDNLVDIQGFYAFTSTKFEEYQDEIEPSEEKFITTYEDSNEELQATIPYIKLDWVKNVCTLTQEKYTEKIVTSEVYNKEALAKYNIGEVIYSDRVRVKPTKMDIF